MNQILDRKSPLYFIGIGGSGMSVLAEIAFRRGFSVLGSDEKDSETISILKKIGIKIFTSHQEKIPDTVETVIISSAIKGDNPELIWAKQNKKKIIHRSDFLSFLMQGKRVITVAGTHGKTTTAAMIGHMLNTLGFDPTVAIGGKLLGTEGLTKIGSGDYFVAEADESDGSFLKYRSDITVITNVDFDHMEFFGDKNKLVRIFSEFLGKLKKDGTAIFGWDSEINRNIAHGFSGNKLTYGFIIGSEVRAIHFRFSGERLGFTAIVEKDQTPCLLNTFGKYNAQNALAALSIARVLGLDIHKASESIGTFPGVARRSSIVFNQDNVLLIDDYAHNPGKIRALVSSIKESWPTFRLVVVFEPHRFSRLATLYQDFLNSFTGADEVIVLPIYAAGETANKDISTNLIAEDIKKRQNIATIAMDNFNTAVDHIDRTTKQNTIILTMGAGDVWKLSKILKERWVAHDKKFNP